MKGVSMVLVIFLLALVMIVAGGAGLVAGLALTPTDLGFTYMQSGTIALSAGMVMMAIGLGVRVVAEALSRIASPAPIRAEAVAPEAVESMQPGDNAAPGSSERSGLAGKATLAAGAAVATGAAALVLGGGGKAEDNDGGSGVTGLRSDAPMADPAAISLDQLEMDLLDIAASKDKETEPAKPSDEIASEAITAEPDSAEIAEIAVAEDQAVAPPAADVPAADAPAEDAPAEIAPAASPTPGLIADPDFEAVLAEPTLAPISTLEVVGSYDSGGTRFTMYSDGSVVAAAPEGEQRFRSLEALRAYIDSSR